MMLKRSAKLLIRALPARSFGMLASVPMGPPDKILGLNVLFKVSTADCTHGFHAQCDVLAY